MTAVVNSDSNESSDSNYSSDQKNFFFSLTKHLFHTQKKIQPKLCLPKENSQKNCISQKQKKSQKKHLTKLINSKFDKIQKLKMHQNTNKKLQILQNSVCDKT